MDASLLAGRESVLTVAILLLRAVLGVGCVEAAESWQVDWEKTLEAGKREGQVMIYAALGPYQPGIFAEFQKDYPAIRAVIVTGRSSQMSPRLLAERRAGKYLADVYMGGPTSLYNSFYLGKRLDPITPLLILPEITDRSKWWEGRHYYIDPEERYIFVNEGTVSGASIISNARLVMAGEIKSSWDILNSKWKGKIVSLDARVPGLGESELRFIYYHPELGPEFIKRLFSEMDVTLSRDQRQAIDWVATGRYAFCIFCRSSAAMEAKAQGLPVDHIHPASLREMPRLRGSASAITFMNRSPHPNAAKVFINWFLSRRGQIVYQESHGDRDSLRVDIPKDRVPLADRRVEGRKYFFVEGPEFMDDKAVTKVMDEALTSRKKSR